jgi:hypothetical protein
MSDFFSEDDLDTWEGFLRYHHQDPATADPEQLEHYRKQFEQRLAAAKFGSMKLPPMKSSEHRYAVAVREGSDLWLTTWVRRSTEGDVFVMTPRTDKNWDPHISYHRDGSFHAKSFNGAFGSQKRQPPTSGFKGSEHLCMLKGHGPKSIGAVCVPTMFTKVLELPPGLLGPIHGFVAVDLVEPNCEPLEFCSSQLSRRGLTKSRRRGL